MLQFVDEISTVRFQNSYICGKQQPSTTPSSTTITVTKNQTKIFNLNATHVTGF